MRLFVVLLIGWIGDIPGGTWKIFWFYVVLGGQYVVPGIKSELFACKALRGVREIV